MILKEGVDDTRMLMAVLGTVGSRNGHRCVRSVGASEIQQSEEVRHCVRRPVGGSMNLPDERS